MRSSSTSSRLWPWPVSPETTTCLRSGDCTISPANFSIELLGHHQHARAAVRQHELVVGLGHQRVDRHRDDAGLERAEERGRPVDGVEQANQNALFALHAERAQHRAEALDAVGELAVGPGAARIDERGLVGAAGLEVAVQDVGREIVVARNRARPGGHRRVPPVRGHRPQQSSHPLQTDAVLCRWDTAAAIVPPNDTKTSTNVGLASRQDACLQGSLRDDFKPRPHPDDACRQPAAQSGADRSAGPPRGRRADRSRRA